MPRHHFAESASHTCRHNEHNWNDRRYLRHFNFPDLAMTPSILSTRAKRMHRLFRRIDSIVIIRILGARMFGPWAYTRSGKPKQILGICGNTSARCIVTLIAIETRTLSQRAGTLGTFAEAACVLLDQLRRVANPCGRCPCLGSSSLSSSIPRLSRLRRLYRDGPGKNRSRR